jgi:thiol-disulfide isomerase/thioredoxin
MACAAIAATASANAAQRMSFEGEAFDKALGSGKSILVHVTAAWCGECKLQKPIVAHLAEQPDFKDVTLFDVDFDTQKDVLRELHVQKQSTLLAFKNGKEVARLVGDTRPKAIEALMRKAL